MWFNKKVSDDVRIKTLETDFNLLSLKLKALMDQMENLEIKILESKKIYQRKLKNLVECEEKTDNNIKPNVFLSPNGNPI